MTILDLKQARCAHPECGKLIFWVAEGDDSPYFCSYACQTPYHLKPAEATATTAAAAAAVTAAANVSNNIAPEQGLNGGVDAECIIPTHDRRDSVVPDAN